MVRARLREAKVELDVDVDDLEVEVTGATPMIAMAKAVEAMRPKLVAPPLTDEDVRALGAKDSASARHIVQVLRKIELRLSSDLEGDVASLIAADPESPWPYVLANFSTLSGGQEWTNARKKALTLVDKLPPARAHVIRGALMTDESPAQREE